jgi:hypothetical protein
MGGKEVTVIGFILLGVGIAVGIAAMTQPLYRKPPRKYTQEALLCIFGPSIFLLPGAILIVLGSH